jgi:hypothetical protein
VGCVVPQSQTLLWPHPRPSPPPSDFLSLYRRVFAFQPATRGSPIYSECASRRAAFLTPADRAAASGCCFTTRTSLCTPHTALASATTPRTSGSARLQLSGLQNSLYATARRFASPAPARTFTLELSPFRVTSSDVEYDYVGSQPTPTTGLAPATHTALWAAHGDVEMVEMVGDMGILRAKPCPTTLPIFL